jgi:nicotinate phosphoribosyltransferase
MWRKSELSSGLLTDFYHVDAAYVSWRAGLNTPATFDLYTRHAPFGSAYLLTAGLEIALTFATHFHYTEEEIAYLRTLRPYDEGFLDELRRLRFTGEILAIPEGEVAFANEPLLRVTAPFREALLLESGLLHTVGVSTLIATKAARVVHAARGRPVAEFGYRRAQEPYLAARSAIIGGCASTSFLSAAHAFKVPTSGTIPHALVQLFPTEEDAFRAVAESLERYTFLLDTYDVHRAIHTAVRIALDVKQRLGHQLYAVRLDSGDLLADSRYCRAVLDEAGLHEVRIFASGDLDEYRIDELVSANAPIDAFGVGTSLSTGAGSVKHGVSGGALGSVYKLVNLSGSGSLDARIKLAGEKSTWPGKKQVVRIGTFERDIIQLDDEPVPAHGRPLLQPAIRDGEIVPGVLAPLLDIKQRAAAALAELPEQYKALTNAPEYPVERSAALVQLRERAMAAYAAAGAQRES